MKLAVGIDGVKKEIDVILEFLDRLQFKSPSIDFVSVIEEFRPLDMILGADEFIANATGVDQMSLQKQLADKALDQATEWSRKEKIAAQTHILKGQVGNRLLEFASTHHTDLIALGSSEKAPLERIVLGSIGRKAIINAHASVLIAKKMQAKSGKIKAVLATDHSEYANSCFQLLKEFKPQGIGEIIVVSAYSPGLTELMSSSSEKSQEDALQLLSKRMEEGNQHLIQKLQALDCRFQSRVEAGEVHEVLSRVMLEEKADLLIMGAQGHGFVERMLIGSVSLKQALIEPKSVLILRAKAKRLAEQS